MILCLPKGDSMTCWRKSRKLAYPSAPSDQHKTPCKEFCYCRWKRRGVEERPPLTPGPCTKRRQNPAITVRRVRMLRALHLGGPGGKGLQAESKRMKTLPYEERKGDGKEASSAAKTHRSCWAVTEVPRNSPQHPRPYILHTVLAAYNQRSVQPPVPWW